MLDKMKQAEALLMYICAQKTKLDSRNVIELRCTNKGAISGDLTQGLWTRRTTSQVAHFQRAFPDSSAIPADITRAFRTLTSSTRRA